MILIRHIRKTYPSGTVIDDLSLTVKEGMTVVIQGPSGCGKTTLLRLIAGIERPDAGEIFLNGICVNSPDLIVPPYQRSIAYVFQTPSLFPHMTVAENIGFAMPNLEKDQKQEMVETLLRSAGIEHIREKRPQVISGGEAQRVSILRAVATNRRYLLLDEPFTNLDPAMKDRMIQLIRDYIAHHRVTTIMVTHDREDMVAMKAPVLMMRPDLEEVVS